MVPQGELSCHIFQCDEQKCIEQDITENNNMYKQDVSPSQWNAPPYNTEDWDEELQINKSPFICGDTILSCSKFWRWYIDLKSNLGSNLCALESLPYVEMESQLPCLIPCLDVRNLEWVEDQLSSGLLSALTVLCFTWTVLPNIV